MIESEPAKRTVVIRHHFAIVFSNAVGCCLRINEKGATSLLLRTSRKSSKEDIVPRISTSAFFTHEARRYQPLILRIAVFLEFLNPWWIWQYRLERSLTLTIQETLHDQSPKIRAQ